MFKRIINLLTPKSVLYNDYKKPTFLRTINYYINNNFFTNQNRKYKKYTIWNYTYWKPEILFDTWKYTLNIGKYCSLWSGTKIFLGGNHRYDWISTYPFHQIEDIKEYDQTAIIGNGDVVIWNDVWIWMNVTIMSGVTIGDGAVIAYWSLVTKNVDPYTIVWWFPSKFIRNRFSEQEKQQIIDMKRRDIDEEHIRKNIHFLLSDNISEFIKKFAHE